MPDADSAPEQPATQPVAPAAPAAVVAPVTVAEPDSYPVTLEEFCAEHSKTERSVSLMGAFFFVERQAGRMRDMAENYRTRLSALARSPA